MQPLETLYLVLGLSAPPSAAELSLLKGLPTSYRENKIKMFYENKIKMFPLLSAVNKYK